MVVEDGERDAEREGLLLGPLGGGNADDVSELAGLQEVAELGDDEGGGGAGAEAEDHAALDIVDGLICSELLEVVLGEDGGREGFDGEREAAAEGKGGEGAEGSGGGWREER